MKLSAFLTYVFVTVAATVAIWGAFQAAGHRWWSLVYAVTAFILIFGWDWLTGLARGATSRRKQWSGRVHSSSLAPRRNTQRKEAA